MKNVAKKTLYSFRIAFQTVDEMTDDPNKLVLTILENGQPSYKTILAEAETEEQALALVDAYVSTTSYNELEDGKTIS